MEERSNRFLINLLFGLAICSLLFRVILLASDIHFYHIRIDLIGFALFWSVIATFIHLLLFERRQQIINAVFWSVLFLIYLPAALFIQKISSVVHIYEFENYPREIVIEQYPVIGRVPYATYSEATTYLRGFLYKKHESIDLTTEDLEHKFPVKYERIPENGAYFVWESKRLLFNLNDMMVYPLVRKNPNPN